MQENVDDTEVERVRRSHKGRAPEEVTAQQNRPQGEQAATQQGPANQAPGAHGYPPPGPYPLWNDVIVGILVIIFGVRSALATHGPLGLRR